MAIDNAVRNRRNAASRDRYNAKTYDHITIRVKRDGSDGVSRDLIKAAAERERISVNAWMLGAIKDKL